MLRRKFQLFSQERIVLTDGGFFKFSKSSSSKIHQRLAVWTFSMPALQEIGHSKSMWIQSAIIHYSPDSSTVSRSMLNWNGIYDSIPPKNVNGVPNRINDGGRILRPSVELPFRASITAEKLIELCPSYNEEKVQKVEKVQKPPLDP